MSREPVSTARALLMLAILVGVSIAMWVGFVLLLDALLF